MTALSRGESSTSWVSSQQPNKTTTLTQIVEKTTEMVGKATPSVTARCVARRESENQKKNLTMEYDAVVSAGPPLNVEALTRGIVYEIGIGHDVSAHCYRKDHHHPGKLDRRSSAKSLKKSKSRHFCGADLTKPEEEIVEGRREVAAGAESLRSSSYETATLG